MTKPDFQLGDKVLQNGIHKVKLESNQRLRDWKVIAGPYKIDSEWGMTLSDRGTYNDYTIEVLCKNYHLVHRKEKRKAKKQTLAYFKKTMKKAIKEIKLKLTKPAIYTGLTLSVMLIIGMIFAGNYNSLVSSKAEVDNSWAKVETQYQRRFDLVDNIVASAKGSQLNEQKIFKDIADGRKAYGSATTPEEKDAAAQSVSTSVAVIPKLQEAYPELRSNDQISKLILELQNTENTIATARDTYNTTTKNYNVNIQSFPKNIFAGLYGFEKQDLFKSEAKASKAPGVDFE